MINGPYPKVLLQKTNKLNTILYKMFSSCKLKYKESELFFFSNQNPRLIKVATSMSILKISSIFNCSIIYFVNTEYSRLDTNNGLLARSYLFSPRTK